jgi:hypothetical protein
MICDMFFGCDILPCQCSWPPSHMVSKRLPKVLRPAFKWLLQSIAAIGQRGQICSAETTRIQTLVMDLETLLSVTTSRFAELNATFNERLARLIKDGMPENRARLLLAPLTNEGTNLRSKIDNRNADGLPKQILTQRDYLSKKLACVGIAEKELNKYMVTKSSDPSQKAAPKDQQKKAPTN